MGLKREIGMRLTLVVLFSSSLIVSGLWMGGFLEEGITAQQNRDQLRLEETTVNNEDHQLSVQYRRGTPSTSQVEAQNKATDNEMDDRTQGLDNQMDNDLSFNTTTIETEALSNGETAPNAEVNSEQNGELELQRTEQEQEAPREAVEYDGANEPKEAQGSERKNIQDHQLNAQQETTPKAVVTVSSVDASKDIYAHLQSIEQELHWGEYNRRAVVATGYTAGYESTGKHPDHPQYGITYSGVRVRRDVYSTIAADLSVFPLGTVLYIPNYGFGVVADTGGAIKGDKIDLYFETVEDVYQLWGKQSVEVYVIQEGDGQISEAFLDQLNQETTLVFSKEGKK